MEDSNPELESFRQEWRAEVTARTKSDISRSARAAEIQSNRAIRKPLASSSKNETDKIQEEIEEPGQIYTEPNESNQTVHNDIQGFTSKSAAREPQSALDHYEKAVERENQGSLGDSVALYRKAFKLDHRVDVAYKNKHFPTSTFALKPSAQASTQSPTSKDPKQQTPSEATPKKQSVDDLLAGFAGLSIEPAPAEIENTPAPPCPIADLPEELLIHILTDLAIVDVASFARSAQVCKRLAYLVNTTEQIWKRVCTGHEVGFAAMHYEWQTEVKGGRIVPEVPVDEDDIVTEKRPSPNSLEASTELLKRSYSLSWRQMFRTRPRIRFNGCYISTVNYQRPGQASTNQLTWHSPIHIVTYYRYLRFFRDGTCLSLCAVNEPIEVIPYLTKDFQENKLKVKVDPALALPQSVMNAAHRGRWRLSSAADHPDVSEQEAEGDVYVETEGVGNKYIYRMELNLRSVGRAARNNKLAWKGYWHYNKLTDDWGEFGLRNDKAFFWSRVKSWGMGE